MSKVGDVFIALGLDSEGFQEGVKNARKETAILAAEVLGSLYALDKFVSYSTKGAITLGNLSVVAGTTTQELQHLSQVANLLNPALDVGTAEQSLAAFGKNLQDIRTGQGGDRSGFAWLAQIGRQVDYTKGSTDEVLDSIAKVIETIPTMQSKVQALSKLGLPPEMLQAFHLRATDPAGYQAFDAKNIQSKETIEALKGVGRATAELDQDLENTRDQIVVKLGPALLELVKNLDDGVNGFKDLSATATIASVAIVAAFTPVLGTVLAFSVALSAALFDFKEIKALYNGETTPFHSWLTKHISEPVNKALFENPDNHGERGINRLRAVMDGKPDPATQGVYGPQLPQTSAPNVYGPQAPTVYPNTPLASDTQVTYPPQGGSIEDLKDVLNNPEAIAYLEAQKHVKNAKEEDMKFRESLTNNTNPVDKIPSNVTITQENNYHIQGSDTPGIIDGIKQVNSENQKQLNTSYSANNVGANY